MSIISKAPVTVSSQAPAIRPARRKVHKGERSLRNTVVILVVVFNAVLLVYPISKAFAGSFHLWNPLNGTYEWLGLKNYTDLFTDAVFWKTALNTVVFGGVVILLRVTIGLALAYAIFSKLNRWKSFFRTIFYLPTVTPLVAVAYVWKLAYHPQIGAVDTYLGLNINWLYDSSFALPAIIAMTVWKDFGYAVILLLAGLYSMPEDALEASLVDGCTAWQRFRLVMLPLLRPMMIFVIVTSVIAYLQAYVQILVLTGGGPGKSTYLISFLIYDEAFVKYNFGYASAIAFVLLFFTAIMTFVSFQLSGGRKMFGKGR
jgi:multiple sugar transport system permease protein